jgi:hypothetical protein
VIARPRALADREAGEARQPEVRRDVDVDDQRAEQVEPVGAEGLGAEPRGGARTDPEPGLDPTDRRGRR